jgi:hypothetical protein
MKTEHLRTNQFLSRRRLTSTLMLLPIFATGLVTEAASEPSGMTTDDQLEFTTEQTDNLFILKKAKPMTVKAHSAHATTSDCGDTATPIGVAVNRLPDGMGINYLGSEDPSDTWRIRTGNNTDQDLTYLPYFICKGTPSDSLKQSSTYTVLSGDKYWVKKVANLEVYAGAKNTLLASGTCGDSQKRILPFAAGTGQLATDFRIREIGGSETYGTIGNKYFLYITYGGKNAKKDGRMDAYFLCSKK